MIIAHGLMDSSPSAAACNDRGHVGLAFAVFLTPLTRRCWWHWSGLARTTSARDEARIHNNGMTLAASSERADGGAAIQTSVVPCLLGLMSSSEFASHASDESGDDGERLQSVLTPRPAPTLVVLDFCLLPAHWQPHAQIRRSK